MTCRMDNELGAYVLHALEPEETHAVQLHLTDCQECHDEVRSLASTASMLALLTLPDIEELYELDAVDPEPARPHRHRAALAVAAAVLAIFASAGAVRMLPADHGSPNPAVVRAVDPSTHVRAAVTTTSRSWGTQLHLRLAGAYPSGFCSLVAHSGDGRTDTVATWTADVHGAADVAGATAIPTTQLRELDVVTDSGQLLVRIPLPDDGK